MLSPRWLILGELCVLNSDTTVRHSSRSQPATVCSSGSYRRSPRDHIQTLSESVYYYFRRWQRDGVWDQMLATLRMQMRSRQGRNPEPNASVIDSQSIKTSPVRGPQKGYDPGKKVWGRKRHLLVDTEGNLLAIKVTGANLSDQQGAKLLLPSLSESFPTIKLMWGDSHYGGTFVGWLQAHLGWKMQTVHKAKIPARGLLVAEGEEPDWEARFPSGFVPLPRRWVVERTFGWLNTARRLSKNYEYWPASSEA
jgi:putative transposase